MYRVLALLAGILLVAAHAPAGEETGRFRKIAVLALKEDPEEAIDPSVKSSVLRRLEAAREWGADCIVFEIESYGGMVTSSIETGDEVFDIGRKVHTIAYIPRRAISGAAMLSMSCRQIIMSEAAQIGDSQAVYLSAEGMTKAPEKMQTVVAGAFRKYAEGNGYPIPLAEAMVREEMEVVRYRKPKEAADPDKGFSWIYYRSDTADGEPSAEERHRLGLTDRQVVKRAGELPTLSAKEAMEFGLCSRLAPDLDSLLATLKAPDAEVRRLDWTWAEEFSRWLLGIRFLLFLVGAAALYLALKTPGTGIPEVIALLAFGLFFGASAISGFAGTIEVLLFLAGVVLLAVEIFILPGFGIAGMAGIVLVLLSLGFAAVPERSYEGTATRYIVPMLRDFLLGALGALVLAFYVARNLPKIPLLRRLALPEGTAPALASTALEPPSPLVGRRGVAETSLRPSGRALIDGQRMDVVSEGGWAEAGDPVEVVEVRGPVVVVRALRGRA